MAYGRKYEIDANALSQTNIGTGYVRRVYDYGIIIIIYLK